MMYDLLKKCTNFSGNSYMMNSTLIKQFVHDIIRLSNVTIVLTTFVSKSDFKNVQIIQKSWGRIK